MPDFSNHPLKNRYNLDTAMSAIWEFYKKWFLPLFVISFISSLLTAIVSSKIDLSGLQSIQDPVQMLEAIRPFAGVYILVAGIGLVFTVLLQYFVIVKPFDDENISSGWILKALGRFLLPMLAVYILLSIFAIIALFLGIIVLIVGAFFALFYVMIFFALAAPVMMIENTSITDTITRAFSLGHKKFWINLGWVALFAILILIITLVLSAIVMIPFTGGFLRSLLNPDTATDMIDFSRRPAYILLSSLAGAITSPIFPIFSLVLYFNAVSYEDESTTGYKGDAGGGDSVTVDDLYAESYHKKKGPTRKKGDERRPTVEDLAP